MLGLVAGARPAAALQGTVPGNAASSWQTNGAVSRSPRPTGSSTSVVTSPGSGRRARPPAPGEVARSHLAAFDASTGALITSFNHNLNGAVSVLSVSPDG